MAPKVPQLPRLGGATSWGPNIQTHKPVGNILQSSRNVSVPQISLTTFPSWSSKAECAPTLEGGGSLALPQMLRAMKKIQQDIPLAGFFRQKALGGHSGALK